MLRNHEKFYAFMALLLSIVGQSILAVLSDGLNEQQLRILEKVSDGLLVVMGASAMSLFRHSQTDENNAEARRIEAEKTPPPTGDAREASETGSNSAGERP